MPRNVDILFTFHYSFMSPQLYQYAEFSSTVLNPISSTLSLHTATFKWQQTQVFPFYQPFRPSLVCISKQNTFCGQRKNTESTVSL